MNSVYYKMTQTKFKLGRNCVEIIIDILLTPLLYALPLPDVPLACPVSSVQIFTKRTAVCNYCSDTILVAMLMFALAP